MHYVKHFDILGVETAQIPCVELQGVPNTATEGAVGLLGVNMLSEDHEVYLCVEVKGNVYTWQSLKDGKDGVSIVKTELNDNCELIITFSNGTQTNLGVIRGEKGEKGEQADLTKIKEKNKGRYVGFWLGDIETFEKLGATEEDTWYLFEDDTTLDEIDKALDDLEAEIGKVSTEVNGLSSRTKAVEDVIPHVEDEISLLSNELRGSMRYINLQYSSQNEHYRVFDDVIGDVVCKPPSLSYKDLICNYLKMMNNGVISYVNETTTQLLYDKDGDTFYNLDSFSVSEDRWVTRSGSRIAHMKFEASKNYGETSRSYDEIGIYVDNNWFCLSIIELETD